MAIGFSTEKWNGEDNNKKDNNKPLVRHYHEDEDIGFYGYPLNTKEEIVKAAKQLSEEDKRWVLKQLKW